MDVLVVVIELAVDLVGGALDRLRPPTADVGDGLECFLGVRSTAKVVVKSSISIPLLV